MSLRRPRRENDVDAIRPRSRGSRPLWVKAAFALAVAAVALAGTAFSPGGGRNATAAARAAATRSNPPLALRGTDPVTGKPVSLAAFAGKPIVLNLWSSSCGACFADARARRRLPLLSLLMRPFLRRV